MANYMALNEYLVKAERNCLGYVGGGAEKKTLSHWLKSKTCNRNFLVWLMLAYMYLLEAPKGFQVKRHKGMVIKLRQAIGSHLWQIR